MSDLGDSFREHRARRAAYLRTRRDRRSEVMASPPNCPSCDERMEPRYWCPECGTTVYVCDRHREWGSELWLCCWMVAADAEIARLAAELAEVVHAAERTAPVQGHEPIPWSLHLRAYAAYQAKYGSSQSAERVAARGGFHVRELDTLYPQWRAECEENATLKARVEELEGALRRLLAAIDEGGRHGRCLDHLPRKPVDKARAMLGALGETQRTARAQVEAERKATGE